MSAKPLPFLLVHGAWQGGWVWHRVASRLRAAGHETFTPTLSGLGDRAHLAGPQIDLLTHVRDVVATIETEELNDLVLCGHSYGGMVVTGAADRLPRRIKALVFLDAFIGQPGKAVFDFQSPDLAERLKAEARDDGEGWRIKPRPASYFRVADPADAARLDRLSVDQPIGCMATPLPLTGAWQNIRHRIYIRAIGHKDGPFGRFTEAVRNDPGWRYFEVPCGHQVMLDMPQALAGILCETAAIAGSAGE